MSVIPTLSGLAIDLVAEAAQAVGRSIEEEIKDGKNPQDAALDDRELDEEDTEPTDAAAEQQQEATADGAAEDGSGGRTES